MSRQKGRDAVKTDRSIGGCSCAVYRQPLVAKIDDYLSCLSRVEDPAARRWTPLASGTAAVLMALDVGCSLAVRCEDALACMKLDFSCGLGDTFNGLIKALERQATLSLPVLKAELRTRARTAFKSIPRVAGWTLLAVDGSKEDLPRTVDNESVFGIADNGAYPQAFTTVIVEVQSGLAWDWRVGPGRSDERAHLRDMAPQLPDDALLLGDGGFLGYPVWSTLMQAGKSFLIRVGGNARLLTDLFPDAHIERRGGIVYAWPRHQRHRVPPLRLRLIKVGSREDPVHLLTNVLDSTKLSRKAAGTIYRLRWGVELFYRTLKRTLGYAKLRSRSGRRAAVELEWGLITATIVALIGIRVLRRRRIDARRLSPSGLLRVLRGALLRGVGALSHEGVRILDRALAGAVKDRYRRRRPKHSRHNPTTRNTPVTNIQPPQIRRATPRERRLALRKYPSLAP